MGLLARMLTIVMALLGGVVFSQGPEFAQQYRQRIGGALDELRKIVEAFDSQAVRNGLDRQEALSVYAASPEVFLRNQGDAMRRIFERYDRLSAQQRELLLEPPVTRPLVLLRRPDLTLATKTWNDFVPAVPVDLAGLIWGAAGCILGWATAAGCGAARRGITRAAGVRRA
ncbi:DUF2937 family protein [Rhizobium azibense]|nr:DUF2937 family protein [Rhizobium azibense]